MFFRPFAGPLLLSAALALPAWGQQDPDNHCPSDTTALSVAQAEALARRYAPVLRFAPREQYFPTIPYLSAWDGMNNNRDAVTDLADPDEIAPRRNDQVYWDRVDSIYQNPFDTTLADTLRYYLRSRERAAAFYRVRDLCRGESNELKRFLRSDEQAWRRINHDKLNELGKDLRFRVVEYYFYYVRDRGLEGHPQDIEFVYLFLPYRREIRRGDTLAPDLASGLKYRIVVGGGHTYRTPNNILVMSGEGADRDTTLNVLVELGGHSSAPDYPPRGVFVPGLDVNYHVYDIWGTRDIQAVAGVGFDGPYQTSMTFPRDTIGAVTLYPSHLGTEAVDSLVQSRVAQQAQPVKTPEPAPAPEPPAAHRGPCGHNPKLDRTENLVCSYVLLPLDPFKRLSLALERPRHQEDQAERDRQAVTAVSEIQRLLGEWNYRGFRNVTDTVATLRRMRDWNLRPAWSLGKPHQKLLRIRRGKQLLLQKEDVPGTLEVRRHRIWDHEQFTGSPTQILKKHLYRPAIAEFTVSKWDWFDLLTYGITNQPSRSFQIHGGIVIPAIPLPVRFPGFMELQFGLYGPQLFEGKRRISYAGAWTSHYNSRLSMYLKVDYVPHRREMVHDNTLRDVNLSGGISILASLGRKAGFWGNLGNTIRIRTGLVLNPQSNKDLFSRAGWEIQVTFRQ